MKKNTNLAKKLFTILFAAALVLGTVLMPLNAEAKTTKTITRIGTKSRTVKAGQEFELKVKKARGVKEKNLKWSISNSKIVAFEDNDRYDDEMDFIAKKAGTTKITCKNTKTGEKITFSITVKKGSTTAISRVGAKTRTVGIGREFELEVKRASKVKKRDLKWTIKDTSIVDFEDPHDSIYDDEMEFVAKKKGTTTIKCTNVKTKKSVSFTIKVSSAYN